MNPSPLALAVADSLFDDPFYQTITVDFADQPEQRRQRLGAYVQHSIDEGRLVGRVDELGIDGAAIWMTSNHPVLLASARQTKIGALGQVLGSLGFGNYTRMVQAMEHRLHGLLREDIWYLSILGVAPSKQGRGLGTRLLQPALEAADRAGKGCYLETFGSRTLPFYERLGFAVTHVFEESVTREPYWVMVRPPIEPS